MTRNRTQNTSPAVMARRREPNDSLDYFPTPPWATRALMEFLARNGLVTLSSTAWEPACGDGFMARPLAEYFGEVFASDVHGYGFGAVEDFLWPSNRRAGWIITNPPFRLASQFALTALDRSEEGVALLVRTAWLEGGVSAEGRYAELFSKHPPSEILQFCDRVPMVKGTIDEDASTATAYCWVVWRWFREVGPTRFHWLPPCRSRLERQGDYPEKETPAPAPMPLFDEDAAP